MAATPMPVRLRPNVQGHADAITGVVGNAPYFGEFPALSQVARTHLSIGLEATAGENHRFTVQILEPLWALDSHPNHAPLLVLQEPHAFGGIAHLHTQPLCHRELLIGEA